MESSSFLSAFDAEPDSHLTDEEIAKRTEETVMPDDSDIVSARIEAFMQDLYFTDRYAEHNERILGYYDAYFGRQDEPQSNPDTDTASDTHTIDKMALILHDFVEHGLLKPEKTSAKQASQGRDPEHPEEIKRRALEAYNELLDYVDPDSLEKAYLFATDTSKWESEARKWRPGAIDKIDERVAEGTITPENAVILKAAINKTPDLDEVGRDELEQVLRMSEHYLADLGLGAISEAMVKHNIKGVVHKSIETLDLIRHPAADNPAATYRDCTEAISVFAPTLMALGYKQPVYKKLALDLRDAALQWFFDDPNGDAQSQRTVSELYSEDIETCAVDLLEAEFGGIKTATEARVKSEGSLRQKLASKDYIQARRAPDGVGLTFIVPNDMTTEEITQFSEQYSKKLASNPQIGPGHPIGSAFDDMQGDRRKESGYEAVHMTFYYHPAHYFPSVSPLGHTVPFEIQVLTQEQHRMKIYGRYSDLFYQGGLTKIGTGYDDTDQPHLDHLEKRAHAENELAPGTTVQSIAEMVAKTPEIPSVFNKLFRAVDINGARILVPPELEEAVRKLPPHSVGPPESLTVLPPTYVSKAQFLEAISKFGKELAGDKDILNALELAEEIEAGMMRDDGVTPVFEGHILPTALSAVMLAIQSGEIWGGDEESHPTEYISNIATAAILHDYPEKRMETIDGRNAKVAERELALTEIKHKYSATVAASVRALTIPVEIVEESARRDQFTTNILDDEKATLVKPLDRINNHIADIKLLQKLAQDPATAAKPENQKIIKEKMAYFAKSARHMPALFESPKLPPAYSRSLNIMWQLAKQVGYKQL